MRLTIKTLQQNIFHIDVEATETIKVLKEKIQAEKGDSFPVDCQKLIYSGKILENDQKVEHYNFDVTKFIVVMVTKPKTPAAAPSKPKEEAKPSTAATTSSPAATSTPAQSAPTATPTTTPAAPAASDTSTATSGAQAALVTNENYEETVQNIMAFGYPRDQVEAALAACYNNPDRAVDFLEGGEGAMEDMLAASMTGASPAASSGGTTPNAQAPSSGIEGMLNMISENPALQQMVEQVRQNPSILQTYMEQIGRQNPDLLRYISEHQSDFVQLINDPEGTNPPSGGGTGAANPPAAPPGTTVIPVTAAERGEIEQLMAMGFSEQESVEAYMACEKNVERAANFLLSSN